MTLDQLPDILLKTELYPLMILLLPAADNDVDKAWDGARDTILLYDPRSEAEFRLAARVAVFNIQATHAAAHASTPGLPLTAAARLRGAASTLAREADRAERELEKLRKARQNEAEPANDADQTPPPSTETARTAPAGQTQKPSLSPALKAEIRQIAAYARKHNLTYAKAWTQFELEKKRRAAAQTTPFETTPVEAIPVPSTT